MQGAGKARNDANGSCCFFLSVLHALSFQAVLSFFSQHNYPFTNIHSLIQSFTGLSTTKTTAFGIINLIGVFLLCQRFVHRDSTVNTIQKEPLPIQPNATSAHIVPNNSTTTTTTQPSRMVPEGSWQSQTKQSQPSWPTR